MFGISRRRCVALGEFFGPRVATPWDSKLSKDLRARRVEAVNSNWHHNRNSPLNTLKSAPSFISFECAKSSIVRDERIFNPSNFRIPTILSLFSIIISDGPPPFWCPRRNYNYIHQKARAGFGFVHYDGRIFR